MPQIMIAKINLQQKNKIRSPKHENNANKMVKIETISKIACILWDKSAQLTKNDNLLGLQKFEKS